MATLTSDTLSDNAGEVARGILESAETQNLWNRYHPSACEHGHEHNHDDDHHHCHSHDHLHNPTEDIVAAIQKSNGDFTTNPELLAFLRRLVSIQHSAISDTTKDLEDRQLKMALGGLRDYLDLQALDVDVPKLKKLPKDYQAMLRSMEHHTAKGGIGGRWGPFYTMRKILRETGHHVLEEVKENPKSSAILGTLGFGGALFMNASIGSSAISYIDPEALKTNNFSSNALLDMQNFKPEDAENALITTSKVNVHNETQVILEGFGFSKERAAELAADLPSFLHYGRIKTLAQDSQAWMNSAYDWWNTRIAWFTADPNSTISDAMFQDSAFKQAFDYAATNMAEFWYAANTYENFVFHSLVTFAGASIAYKAGNMKEGEASHHLEELKDFGKRSWANSKLSYIFATAGALQGYMTHDAEQLPWTVIGGVGGMLLGEGVHRAHRYFTRKKHAKNTTLNVKENLTAFSDPANITFNGHSTDEIKRPHWLKRHFKNKKVLSVLGGLSALSLTDIMLNSGEFTGYFLGGASVTTQFFAFNAVEDTSAHIVFSAVGAMFGLAGAMVKRTADTTYSALRGSHPLKPTSALGVIQDGVDSIKDDIKSVFNFVTGKTRKFRKEREQDQAVQRVIDNAKEDCLGCQKFGTSACPAFQAAVNDNGVNEDKLKHAITAYQAEQTLVDCSNG